MVRPIRSTTVCGALLRKYRTTLNWSQEELAKASGYSSRLIRKLESGGTTDFETLCNIAEALSVSGQVVTAALLQTDNLTIAKAWMEALNSNGQKMVDRMANHLSSDFEFFCPGDSNYLPFAGTWKGTDGLQRFLDIYFSIFERIPHDEPHYTIGENLVVARYFERGMVNGSPTPPIRISLCFHFKDGQIHRIDDDYDVMGGQDSVRLVNSEESKQLSIVTYFLRHFDLMPQEIPIELKPFLSKDFTIVCDRTDLAFGGKWRGVEGWKQFFKALSDSIQSRPSQFTHEILRSQKRILAYFNEEISFFSLNGPLRFQLAFHLRDGLIESVVAQLS